MDPAIHVKPPVVPIPYNALLQMEVFTASDLVRVNSVAPTEKEMPVTKDITARKTLMGHGAVLMA